MTSLSIPDRLKQRPMHGEYPVPYLVMWEKGTPDFRVTDMSKWHEVVRTNLCSLCGAPNDYWLYFIGGDISILQTRLFFDPPMHHDCALYALRVCPYLAAGRDRSYRHVDLGDKAVQVDDNDVVQNLERPTRFGLGKTRGYDVVWEQGKQLLRAKPWVSVTWWKDGVMVA